MAGILFAVLALSSCASPAAFLAAVLIHEAAHILCAAFFGWGKPRVSAGLTGVRLSYEKIAAPWQEAAVALAGPAANLLTVLIFCRHPALCAYSLGLFAVNLLPVSCLDGGGALSAVLSLFLLPDTVWRIIRATSVVCVLAVWALNIAIQLKIGVNVTLLAVSLYLTVTVMSRAA